MHNIEYFFRDQEGMVLDECSIEHIEKMIKAGCNQGELCQVIYVDHDEDTFYGWWKIDNK